MIRINFDELFKEPLWNNGKAIARGLTAQESRALANAYRKIEADYGRLLTGHALREEQSCREIKDLRLHIHHLIRILDGLMQKPIKKNRGRIRSAKKEATQVLEDGHYLNSDEED